MEEPKVIYETNYLFSKSSFWRGFSSVLNLPGNFYEFNTSETETEADQKALTSDWQNVGEDLRNAEKKFVKQNFKKLCLK